MGSNQLPRAHHCWDCLQRNHLNIGDLLLLIMTQVGLSARTANRRLRRGRRQA
jgi:hypothetical protein